MPCPGVVFVADEVKVLTGAGTTWLARSGRGRIRKSKASNSIQAGFITQILTQNPPCPPSLYELRTDIAIATWKQIVEASKMF